MSKLDLKAALDSLQIKRPFRLPSNQPVFQPPPPVVTETPVRNETQVENLPVVDAVTPPPETTLVDFKTQDIKTTGVNIPSKLATEQDSSVTLEAQNAPKLHQGYTRIPNGILMRMAEGEFIKSEIQVLLVIARFTISFQKRHAPLSKSVLERQTGLRGPAILQAIGSLTQKKVIEKIPGDQYRPNQLGLVFDDEFDFFSGRKKKSTIPATTSVEKTSLVPAGTGAQKLTPAEDSTETPGEVAGGTYFKESQTILNELSLSETPIPETVKNYFSALRPLRKKESEWKAYLELTKTFSQAEISQGMVTLYRDDPKLTKYHSPMAYLSFALQQLLMRNTVGVEVESQRTKKDVQKRNEERIEKEKALEWEAKERAFQIAFPDAESERAAIEKYAIQSDTLTLVGGPTMKRGIAISRWWEEK